MKINYLKTIGFRKFEKEFETELYDVTKITGKNRAGKSNILFAIINIFLGTNLTGDDKSCLINKNCDSSYGEIHFTDNIGQNHVLIRSKNKYNNKENYLLLDGKAIKQDELIRFYKDKRLLLSIYAKYFNKKGSFQQRFGVPKSFLKFMVDNDLAYDEYKILKLLQEPNYELIQQYRKYDYNYLVFMKKQNCLKDLDVIEKFKNCEKTLRNICKYVPLRKFLSYEKGVKNIQIYSDYLSMLKQLNYKMKCRKELFPKQLIASHNKVMKKLKFIQDVQSHYGVYVRFLELSKYIYEDDNYIIFPAQSIDAMKDESEQQGNCVGYLYIKPYIDKKTEIFFIRKVNDVTKSFITLEFKDGVVAQKELPNHGREFSKGQIEFIDKWIKYRLFVDKKERYKCKKVDRIIKYELNKLAV